MKGIIKALIMSVFILAVFSACTGTSEKNKVVAVNDTLKTVEQKDIVKEQAAGPEHPGKAVFAKYCLVCHQADGSGVPGMHPPLTPGSWVGNDPKELIAIMMKGLSGKIEVNGETYNGFMPSQAQLTDEEIADVLSYIRSSFGNNFEAVDVKLVKKIRSGK